MMDVNMELLKYYEQNQAEPDYVRDGLVLWLDGINNTRHGHDENSTAWEDLSGNEYDFTVNILHGGFNFQPLWGDNYFHSFSEVYTRHHLLCDSLSSQFEILRSAMTVEMSYNYQIVEHAGGNGLFLFVSDNFKKRLFCADAANQQDTGIDGVVISYKMPNGWVEGRGITYIPKNKLNEQAIGKHSFVASHAGKSLSAYIDNVNVCTLNGGIISDYSGMNICGLCLNRQGNAKFYSLRIYNRALTAAEIAHNYSIDKARFNLP